MQDQVTRLEQSNRDTLSLLDAKSKSHDKLTEELSVQHQKTINLRREISTLEERNQATENTLSGANFRESSLRQEIELLKRNNEWFEAELKTKSAEYSKYRKEKSARITELQRLNEDSTATIDSLKRTEGTLRKRIEELAAKAEEGFARIQSLQEDAARNEESFRAELDNGRRLAELHKQSADTERRRVHELDQLLEQIKDDAANEISQVQSELESERQGHEAAESRVEQLESELENVVSEAAERQSNALPGTPRRTVNGPNVVNTPVRPGSPAFSTPGSTRNRGGLSMTQMYTDYTNVKTELDTERRRNEKLTTTIDEMIRDLEKKEPELQELQTEHTRLEAEVTHLSALLAKAAQEKDAARKESRKFEGQAAGLQRESDLLRQQLRDHSAQIKVLLVEIQSHQDGSAVSAAERALLEQAARAEASDNALEGMSDTGRFISQRLTTFKTIFELQERNAQLLHLTRQLGERMEGDEARAQQNQQQQDQIELKDLRDNIERYKDEVKSLVTQSQSYIRERDMFRRMLAHRGQLPAGDLEAHFGSSVNGPMTPRTPRNNGGAPLEDAETTKQLADYAKLIKELQSHFDAYRHESATDMTTYKAQVSHLAKEKADLQGEIARASSQVTLAQERYEMLQANYQLLKTENGEHQKRVQSYAEIAAKQDIRTQQVAEELVDARGHADSMRNDIANLKAERELWKKIESRLRDDNQSLAEEKAKLNKIVTDTQNLANERELSDSETRRKLQNQVEGFESEMRFLKRKLDDEVEENKKNSMRREYEQEQSRKRIDDLVMSLGNVKEELAAAKTLRDQHQIRVEELKIELRNAEEREQALRPRTSPHADPSVNTSTGTNAEEDSLNREQELGIEVADLKKELQLANGSLEAARAQVEQYKAISQSSEEELQSMNESQDQYREEMDRVIAEKESKVQELEQRIEDIMAELTTTNNQLSELRISTEDTATRLNQQQATFETEINRIKDESEKYMEMARFNQEDLKAQAEIAQQAQQSYENELLKHAEAAKALQKARTDLNQTKLELSEARADAEAARTTLSQSEESWQSTRDRYELELTDIKTRHHEIDAQNKILHQQLENVGSQITGLQQSRVTANADAEIPNVSDSSLHNLQEVIKYLRREKEIIDVQYELSIQEAKRLRQQLDYSQTQLDDTRLRLDQERQRQTDQERSSISHSKLMETINELNVFRESSVTLRNEARQAQKQLAEKAAQVDELLAQIQPLQTSVRDLENEREIFQGERKLLEEDRDRWQQRTQNILQKYDRVDPAELEGLKEKLTSLQQERDDASLQRQSLQERVDQIPDELQKAAEEKDKQFEERRTKLVDQFKARSRELSGKISAATTESKGLREQVEAVNAELETAKTNLETARAELETTKRELESTKSTRDEAFSRAVAAESRLAQTEAVKPSIAVSGNKGVEDGQVEEGEVDNDSHGTGTAAAEQLAQQESARAALLQQEVKSLQKRVVELEAETSKLQQDLDAKSTELSTLQTQVSMSATSDSNELLEKLKHDLNAAQQEVDALRNKTAILPAADGTVAADATGSNLVEAQVTALVASIRHELETAHQEKIREEEEKYKERVTNMRNQLSTKLADGKVRIREEISKGHEEAMQSLQHEHDAKVQLLTSAHEAALSELKAQHAKEMEALQTQISSAPSTAPKEQGDVVQNKEAPAPKTEAPTSQPNLNDGLTTLPQVQAFLLTNEHAKGILLRNLRARLEQQAIRLNNEHEQALTQKLLEAKAEQEKTLQEEHEKLITSKLEESATNHERSLKEKLEEAAAGFQKSKEQAVILEGKKWTVKISMLEGRNRQAMAKIEFFQKAAQDTPQKPVAEVWAIAKDIKAPPAAVTPAPAGLQSPSVGTSLVRQASISQPAQTPSQPVAAPAPTLKNSQPAQTPPRKQSATSAIATVPAVPPPIADVQNSPGAHPATLAVQNQVPTGTQQQGAAGARGLQQGRGQTAPRNMQNAGSAIPIPRGGRGGPSSLPQAPPGGLNIRGGAGGQRMNEVGKGRGRGGHNSPNGSPGSGRGGGNMNAGARQFIPQGNKRPHEGGDAGPEGFAGKRPRGQGPDGN